MATNQRPHIDDPGPMVGTVGYDAIQANRRAAELGEPIPYRFEYGQAVKNDNRSIAEKALLTTITAPARVVMDTGGLASSVGGWLGEGGPVGVVNRLIEGEENWFTGDDNAAYQFGRALHEVSASTIPETATGGKGGYGALAFATDVVMPAGAFAKTEKGAQMLRSTARVPSKVSQKINFHLSDYLFEASADE